MQALRTAKLYVNRKKTHLFCHEVKFLGHRISQAGIEADHEKVAKILATLNKSTGYSPFQLRFGKSPRVLPPLVPLPPNPSREHVSAREVIQRVRMDVADARDNLLVAKISQAHHANESRVDLFLYKVGDWIMLSTLNRRRKYKNSDDKRVANSCRDLMDLT